MNNVVFINSDRSVAALTAFAEKEERGCLCLDCIL